MFCPEPQIQINAVNNLTTTIQNTLQMTVSTLLNQILENSSIRNINSTTAVYIKNIKTVQQKLEILAISGKDKLEIITDFDRTLSKYCQDGELVPTSYGIFESDPELTETAKSTLINLRNKYYPIELDNNLTENEKTPYMLEWWELAHEVIIECGIQKHTLEKTVKESHLVLRDKVSEFFQLLSDYHIPVLVFSAGLGDVIDLSLHHANVYHDNMRVVSNFMQFNDNGKLIGFSSPIIHVFNKTAGSIINNSIPKRPNVLLLGDSPGDVHMADGATIDDPTGQLGTVLRIGFLNESVQENLEKYQSLYDIVLVNDSTFEIPYKIIQSILCHNE
uniref:5'-nucleotidase n=1 Tax=Schistosoma mansoni TaxID=6183 RepID=A0A5K4EJM6_SCHMA